jgi:hypothetical protein
VTGAPQGTGYAIAFARDTAIRTTLGMSIGQPEIVMPDPAG